MKKKLLSLLLIIVVCLSSSTVFAGGYSYDYTQLGKIVSIKGQTTATTFYGSTVWGLSGGEVQMQALVYANMAGGVQLVQQDATDIVGGSCSISQDSGDFNILGFTINKVKFIHSIYHQNLSNGTYDYIREATY